MPTSLTIIKQLAKLSLEALNDGPACLDIKATLYLSAINGFGR